MLKIKYRHTSWENNESNVPGRDSTQYTFSFFFLLYCFLALPPSGIFQLTVVPKGVQFFDLKGKIFQTGGLLRVKYPGV